MRFCPKCQKETERNAKGDCKVCHRARESARRLAFPDAKKASDIAYREANKEKIREKKAAYCSANKDKSNARLAKWRALNPEKNKAMEAAYRAANPEKVRAATAAWAKANPEKQKALVDAWNKKNPDSRRIRAQNRRSKKRENGGRLSKSIAEKLFKLQCGKCACCGKPLGDNYHLDHIMPIKLGGPNTDDNIQLLRQTCNIQKSAKHPVEFMQQRGFLL